jgi:16S rRNA (guanine966-N2)-methyltransferase
MRIIAGRFRRRTLETNPGNITRPITDRVKETLFARLEARLQGRRVADIFAGTGTLGLEALSRGAERVTFIEKDRPALELLRQNVRKLKVETETLIWPADVMRCSFRPQRAEGFTPFDVIFFDPPYKLVPEIAAGSPLYRSLQRLASARVSAPEALLLLRIPEHSSPQIPPEWQLEWTLTMSNMSILHLVKSPAAAEAVPAEADEPEPPADAATEVEST